MIKPRFLPAAEAELLKEVTYYSNAREGLGVKFQAAVMVAVQKAAVASAEVHIERGGCRELTTTALATTRNIEPVRTRS